MPTNSLTANSSFNRELLESETNEAVKKEQPSAVLEYEDQKPYREMHYTAKSHYQMFTLLFGELYILHGLIS